MTTNDPEVAAIKLLVADIDCAGAVNNILSTGTHATLSDRDANIIRRTFPLAAATDFLNALQTGSVTLKQPTADFIIESCGVNPGKHIVTLANAVT